MRFLHLVSAAALLALATAADAHPKLLNAAATPRRIELHFSESLMPQFSSADLKVAGAGAKLPSTANVGPDHHTLIVSPRTPLRAGRYAIAWRVVSVDTHRVTGTFTFTVKG